VVSKEQVESIHEKTKFQVAKIEQVLNLAEILKAINEDPDLRDIFVLIGGTAINLLYADIPRLSVDIDIDLCKKDITFSEAQNLIPIHRDIIERIAKSLDMECGKRESRLDRPASGRLNLLCQYKSHFSPGGTGIVKLDISYYQRYTVFETVQIPFRSFGKEEAVEEFNVLTVDKHELWGGKAVALAYEHERDPKPEEVCQFFSTNKARHIFDAYCLEAELEERRSDIDIDKLRLCFILKGLPRISELFTLRGDMMRHCEEAEIERELYPYLEEKNRPPIREMRNKARNFLDRVCGNSWTEEEREFAEAYEQGEYCPEILFEEREPAYSHLFHCDYLEHNAVLRER